MNPRTAFQFSSIFSPQKDVFLYPTPALVASPYAHLSNSSLNISPGVHIKSLIPEVTVTKDRSID